MQRRVLRPVGLTLALALGAPACSGGGDPDSVAIGSEAVADDDETAPSTSSSDVTDIPPLLDGGVVSEAALAALLRDDGEVDATVLDSLTAEFSALSQAEQEAVVADLSVRTELAAAESFGLAEAIGGDDATGAALNGAYAQIRSQSDAAAAAVDVVAAPVGLRHGFASTNDVTSTPSSGAVATIGLFMGYLALATFGSIITEKSNGWKAGDTDVHEGDGVVYGASIDEVAAELTFKGKQDGVDVDFTAGAVMHPCPAADGSFTIEALIDVKASKGTAGQNARVELKVAGTVDDNAELADKNIENHTQWSDFADSSGQFLDFTFSGPNGVESSRTNRQGGKVTDGFTQTAALMSALFGLLISTKLLEATEKAWKSGRCVDLKVTPSAGPDGLEPSQVVGVLAEPRSKVDGAPTGGTVTATLVDGASSVEPDGSPVPADANSNYTAAPEQDKKGTVDYESRSRRGVGKASVTFSTSKPAAYAVVGGLEDWQVDMVVCDVMQPFTLESPGVGVANFSGGLTGTYEASGVFNFQYAGTYQITLENGLGTPGTMIATSGGSIAGEAGSGSENYVLTPATC